MGDGTTGQENGRRRRRWSLDEKRAAVELSLESGAAEVAQCLGVTVSRIYGWRRELRELDAGSDGAFLPVTIDPMPVAAERSFCSGMVMEAGRIAVAIDLQGISVLVASGAEPALVTATIAALKGLR